MARTKLGKTHVYLTDEKLRAEIKKARAGQRWELHDTGVPNLLIRVSHAGQQGRVAFYFYGRVGDSKAPTRRLIGRYPNVKLSEARQTAAQWRELRSTGVDPREEERRKREAEARKTPNTFAAAIEAYGIARLVGLNANHPLQRRGPKVLRNLTREFVVDQKVRRIEVKDGQPVEVEVKRRGLGNKPITAVTAQDIIQVLRDAQYATAQRHLERVEAGKAEMGPPNFRNAQNHLNEISTFFAWAAQEYDLATTPTDKLKSTTLLGNKVARERVLDPDEVRAFWWAADMMRPEVGAFFKLLLVAARRNSEACDLPSSELGFEDLSDDLKGVPMWRIPAKRMKGGREYETPLSGLALGVLASIPRPKRRAGPFLFSVSRGENPLSNLGREKAQLDEYMLDILRDIAAEKGRDPTTVTLRPFVLHDLRRTFRSHAAEIEVAPDVPISADTLERILAHKRSGVEGIYNRSKMSRAMRTALELWAGWIIKVVGERPTKRPATVVRLSQKSLKNTIESSVA